MSIVLTGIKATGKSTIGPLLAEALSIPFVDIDDVIIQRCRYTLGETMSCAEIYRTVGELQFRRLEIEAVREIDASKAAVTATGGSSLLTPVVRRLLRARGTMVFLNARADYVWKRIVSKGIPSYLEQHTAPEYAFCRRAELIRSTVVPICDCVVDVEERRPEEVTSDVLSKLEALDRSASHRR